MHACGLGVFSNPEHLQDCDYIKENVNASQRETDRE